MKQALLVGLGGFLGSVGRFTLGGAILHYTTNWRFPVSTFVINVAGCFFIGLLAGLAEHRSYFSVDARLFLFAGLLGGFTTFSAFGYDGIHLLRRGEVLVAIAYALLSILLGWAFVWIGFKLCTLFPLDR